MRSSPTTSSTASRPRSAARPARGTCPTRCSSSPPCRTPAPASGWRSRSSGCSRASTRPAPSTSARSTTPRRSSTTSPWRGSAAPAEVAGGHPTVLAVLPITRCPLSVSSASMGTRAPTVRPPTTEGEMARLPRALAPLRSRDYRLLASSMGLSLFAQGLWTVALVWQVVDLGGGPGALSLATSLQAAGMLASTLLGGALADRVPQRRILLGVALLQTTAVGSVALLSLTGALALGPLAAASLVGGIAMGLYYPAYSALVPGVV